MLILLNILYQYVHVDHNCELENIIPVLYNFSLEGIFDKIISVALLQGNAVKVHNKVHPMSEYGLYGDRVNGTKEFTYGTDGKIQYSGSGSQNFDNGINIEVEVGPSLIHFFD